MNEENETLTQVRGECLCGNVKIQVEKLDPHFGACHCSICQKWSGGPYLAVDCGDQVVFEGEPFVVTYPSSEWAERGFCKQCGSHLFYHLHASNQYIMSLGLFDLTDQAVFDHEIFVDEKPTYYDFANNTTKLTGEEVFAAFTDNNDADH